MTAPGVLTTTGGVVGEDVLQHYKARLRGQVLRPGDAGYDASRRVWNAMIDRRPALIARCAAAADVVSTVRFARENDLLVSVRGGGHNVAGKAVCDGGLMIDLSPMKGVRVDPIARTVHAEAGLTWGELDRETQAHGLATTGGIVSHTGIAGLTLGGGVGWLAREYGLSCDNLLSLNIVTADGRLLRASADENPDLFWAARGAGPNFGIVTSFEYRLHPVVSVVGGMLLYPIERAKAGLKFYAEYSLEIPDELSTLAGVVTVPAGDQMFIVVLSYDGDEAQAERVLRPLRQFATPVVDAIAPRPYLKMQLLLDEPKPMPLRTYWQSHFFERISDDAIEAILSGFRRVPSPRTSVMFQQFGGAVKRVAADATAFYHRRAEYDFTASSFWTEPAADAENIDWTDAFGEAVQPFSAGGVYVNNLGDETPERVMAAYGSNYARLAALKRQYDPANFFRLNQNIEPTA